MAPNYASHGNKQRQASSVPVVTKFIALRKSVAEFVHELSTKLPTTSETASDWLKKLSTCHLPVDAELLSLLMDAPNDEGLVFTSWPPLFVYVSVGLSISSRRLFLRISEGHHLDVRRHLASSGGVPAAPEGWP
ncbi:Hypothetical predicted protein [Cloeon dipterum]|uniref:Uncharacterized protein n=1 Tax=Cloeon dipterum TaxID=197152 RepID=A0A8S1E2Q1_9INSE|nr:Hypothetical predicted protein [Cloeon dipterum]